jgi:hypothetical protein
MTQCPFSAAVADVLRRNYKNTITAHTLALHVNIITIAATCFDLHVYTSIRRFTDKQVLLPWRYVL